MNVNNGRPIIESVPMMQVVCEYYISFNLLEKQLNINMLADVIKKL